MQVPVEITYRGLRPTPREEALVAQKLAQLEAHHPGIISCHLTAGPAQGRQRSGTVQEVTLEVRLPGDRLVVRRHHADAPGHAHLAPVLRDAFDAMTQALSAHRARRRGDIKASAGPMQGRVSALCPDRDCGEILGNDHRLIYFHKNSVLGAGFDSLRLDDPVSYSLIEGEGVQGPQASSVHPLTNLRHDPGHRP